MKQINIPVSQNVEIIIAEVFINVDINLREQMPIKTELGKHAFRQFQDRLTMVAHRLAREIMNELDKDI